MGGKDMDSELYPHHVGHHIGLEIHDCSTYRRGLRLRENQVITIEPAVYIPHEQRWPKQFRGMGLRIEDSVLVGLKEPFILSEIAVKERKDISSLMCS